MNKPELVKREPPLKFESIGERWSPETQIEDCTCGQHLVYGHQPYAASIGDRNIFIDKLYGYYSDSETCHARSLLPQTRHELAVRISEGLGKITHEEAENLLNNPNFEGW